MDKWNAVQILIGTVQHKTIVQEQELSGVVIIFVQHVPHIVHLHVQYVHLQNTGTVTQKQNAKQSVLDGVELIQMDGVLVKHVQLVQQTNIGIVTQKVNVKQQELNGAVQVILHSVHLTV
jgi:hypothetical protein